MQQPAHTDSHLIPFELWLQDFAPGYPTLRISNSHASATIALHGAQIIDYIPNDQEPVLFTSPKAIFKEGKAIRGGIPICWPWFGAHPTDSTMPAHGFARDRFWQLIQSNSHADYTEVTLELDTAEIPLWASPTKLTVTIRVGKQLEVILTTTNTGSEDITIGGALHSYFYVSNASKAPISGLEDTHYLDALDQQEKKQEGPIQISCETDRIYTDTTSTVTISDPGFNRTISIAKTGSRSTVVWNPWIDKTAATADLDDNDFHDFICIETTNALEDVYLLESGASHTLSTTITATPLAK